MNKFYLIALVASAFAPSLSSAQLKNADSNTDIPKIEEANKKISALQCPFQRTTKLAVVTDATKVDGTFYFQSSSNLSMKYDNGESFVVTEDKVSMTIGGKSRTLRAGNRNVEDLSETLLDCVQGKISSIDGTLKSAKTSGKNIVFTISTDMKVGRNKIKTIELAYDKSDYTLNSLNLIEADGSYTLYELKTKTLNGNISSSVFTHSSK